MSDDAQIQPLPVLRYYPGDRSSDLRLLVRLVLMVAIANGLLSALSFISNFLPPWPTAAQPVDWAVLLGQLMAWLTVSVSCLVFLTSGHGRVVAMSAQGSALVLDACYYVRQFLLYPQLSYLTGNLAALLSDWLIPLLVIVVLSRHDMRTSASGGPASTGAPAGNSEASISGRTI